MNHLEALVSLKAVGDGFKEDDLFLLLRRLNTVSVYGQRQFHRSRKVSALHEFILIKEENEFGASA